MAEWAEAPPLGVLLDDDGAVAGLGGDGRGGEAAHARAYDHDVGLDVPRLGRLDGGDRHGVGPDVAGGHRHGMAGVRLGAHPATGEGLDSRGDSRLSRRLFGRRRLVGPSRRDNAGAGDDGRGRRGTLDKRTACDVFHSWFPFRISRLRICRASERYQARSRQSSCSIRPPDALSPQPRQGCSTCGTNSVRVLHCMTFMTENLKDCPARRRRTIGRKSLAS